MADQNLQLSLMKVIEITIKTKIIIIIIIINYMKVLNSTLL